MTEQVCLEENCAQAHGNHSHHRRYLAGAEGTYEAALEGVARAVVDTCIERHRKYGLNLKRHGERGILIRIDDKTERLQNMLDHDIHDYAEPSTDSWIDIAGYAMQAIMMRTGTFEYPMRRGEHAES